MTDITTLEDFERACNGHDLTYSYSDDHRWWRAGFDSHRRIERAAKQFPREDVERIWNAMVDRRVVEGVRAQFYWRWPQEVTP